MQRILTALAIVATFGTVPASAADEEEVGILAALGLSAAQGKTDIKDGAGQVEGWLIATTSIQQAALSIADVSHADLGENTKLVLLSDAQKIDGLAYNIVKSRISSVYPTIASLLKDCKTASGGGVSIAESGRSTTEVMNAVIGALKVDTEVRSYDVTSADGAFLNAVAAALKAKKIDAIIPGEISVPKADSAIFGNFMALTNDRDKLKQCPQTDPVKAAVKLADDTEAGLLAPGKDDAPSLLSRAVAVEPIVETNPRVLRIKVEKAGGSIIKRSNIFLQFGFPGALSMTGGLVASYRLTNPSTGVIGASGLLACRVVEQDMSAIHQVRRKPRALPKAECDHIGGVEQPATSQQQSTDEKSAKNES